jgi:hypothetical protein
MISQQCGMRKTIILMMIGKERVIKMARYPVFGERFCTYCAGTMLYFTNENNEPMGICSCGNTDYCDGKTVADVKKQYGDHMKPSKYKFIVD